MLRRVCTAQDRERRHSKIARPDLFALDSAALEIASKPRPVDRGTNPGNSPTGLGQKGSRAERLSIRFQSLHPELLSRGALSILDTNGGPQTAVSVRDLAGKVIQPSLPSQARSDA